MTIEVAIATGTLPTSIPGTVDLTKSGFGTPTAAIIFYVDSGPSNNPLISRSGYGIGFWDGTDQVAASWDTVNAAATSNSKKSTYRGVAVVVCNEAGAHLARYTASAITDGIRLTMAFDNTGFARQAFAILFKGATGKVVEAQISTSDTGTAATPSLGFAPQCAFFLNANHDYNTDADTDSAQLSFGFAKSDGTHRAVIFGDLDGQADTLCNQLVSTNRCAGAVLNDATLYTNSVTTWGSDTLTITTHGTGATATTDGLFVLAFPSALEVDCGTFTIPQATGDDDIAVDFDPIGFLAVATASESLDTLLTSGVGIAGQGLFLLDSTLDHSFFGYSNDGQAVGVANAGYSTSDLDFQAGVGTARQTFATATGTLGTAKVTLNYSAFYSSSSADRYGFWVAFGAGGELIVNSGEFDREIASVALTQAHNLVSVSAEFDREIQSVHISVGTAVNSAEFDREISSVSVAQNEIVVQSAEFEREFGSVAITKIVTPGSGEFDREISSVGVSQNEVEVQSAEFEREFGSVAITKIVTPGSSEFDREIGSVALPAAAEVDVDSAEFDREFGSVLLRQFATQPGTFRKRKKCVFAKSRTINIGCC